VSFKARLYEAVYEVYKIIIPIHAAKRQFKEMEKIHTKLVDCFQNIISKVTHTSIILSCELHVFPYRETREALVLTLELVFMVISLEKMWTDKNLSTESKA